MTQIPISVFRLPHMEKTPYDPLADLTYIIGVSGYTFGVVVRSDAPWKTWNEFVAFAKANPDKISYGTPGANTSLHITMEEIAFKQGIKWVHVPHKGNAPTHGGAPRRSRRLGRRTRPAGGRTSTPARCGCS